MPLKDPEKLKEYNRQYYLKNKEQLKKYHNKNKNKKKEYDKQQATTEKRKSQKRIAQWKYRGILCFDYKLLNDLYLSVNKCEFCGCEFKKNNKKSLDHDHSITDKFNIRGVLCFNCNINDVLK